MALPESLTYNLSPPEISFLSENEYITILPRYSMKKIELIGVCLIYGNSFNAHILTDDTGKNTNASWYAT